MVQKDTPIYHAFMHHKKLNCNLIMVKVRLFQHHIKGMDLRNKLPIFQIVF